MATRKELRAVERALDELRRGYAVNLEGRAVYAAEAVETPPVGTRILEQAATPFEHAAQLLVKYTGLLPQALLAERPDPEGVTVTIDQINSYTIADYALQRLPEAKLPLAVSAEARIVPFRERGGRTHVAVLMGQPEAHAAPLTRLHSSCLTGDVLGSLRCDCGDQLRLGLEAIVAAGGGILLYLDQEGRGIGLANKLRAYALQDQGYDTVEANLALGFAGDERDFSLGARMLHALGVSQVRLLTNNPAKVEALRQAGIHVAERVPLKAPPGEHNQAYLETKRTRLGHY